MIPTKTDQSSAATAGAGTDDIGRVPGGEAAGGASLDKVRDILFGGQVREFDRRFARLEERLVRETNELKEDVKKRLEALESYTRREAESLSQQIRAEHEDRLQSNGNLGRELKDTAMALERRAAGLDEQLAKAQRELRQQLLEQHQQLSDDMRRKVEDVLATLARETAELRGDKADRAVLASLFTEMALRLTNEFRIPGAEGLENA